MRHPSQLFSMTSNLIPFLGNTSGNRASMASRQMEQAVRVDRRLIEGKVGEAAGRRSRSDQRQDRGRDDDRGGFRAPDENLAQVLRRAKRVPKRETEMSVIIGCLLFVSFGFFYASFRAWDGGWHTEARLSYVGGILAALIAAWITVNGA